MNVDDVVAEKIAAARARAEAAKLRRAAFAAARNRGLALRRAAKLRNQASRGDMSTTDDLRGAESNADVAETATTVVQRPTVETVRATIPTSNRGDIDTVAADSLSAATGPDDVVIEVTEAEFHAAVRTALARLGLTYAELEDQARRRDFTSAQAHSLWVSIGGAVRPELIEENQ